jgi:tRNA threonylcarbamoyladenosine biosynthesis protein TsaB
MTSLLIETSTDRGLLAILEKDRLLYQAPFPLGHSPSQKLIPELEQGLKLTGLSIPDLTYIAVGSGPGSYTGIRVGAITAKTLAFAARIPLVGVCTLKAFIPPTEGPFVAAIDAKIGGVYLIQGKRSSTGVMYHSTPALVPFDEAADILQSARVIVTPNAKGLRSKYAASSSRQSWNWLEVGPDPFHLNQLAQQEWRQGHYSKEGKLELLYLRKTQAEIEKEKAL